MAAGLDVFVQGGGYYQVTSVTNSTTVVLQNLGTPGNTAAGLSVANGAIVAPSGPPLLASPAHSILIGEGLSPVVGVGPSSTTGLPLLSQGASADPAFGVLPWLGGGRLQGTINVTNASPGTFDATHQIAYCDSSTGPCSITWPSPAAFGGSIPADWQILVVDTGGASSTSAISANPNGTSTWDPTLLAYGTSTITLQQSGGAWLYQYDSHKGHFNLVNSGGGLGAGTIGNSGSVVTGSYTLASTDFNTLIAAGAQITGPASPIKGATYRLTPASGTFSTNPALFLGNGYSVFQPDGPLYTAASSAAMTTDDGAPWSWWWDGTYMRIAS